MKKHSSDFNQVDDNHHFDSLQNILKQVNGQEQFKKIHQERDQLFIERGCQRILDIGCGIGTAAIRLAQQLQPSQFVYAVDKSERFLEKIVGEMPPINLRWQQGDVYQLDFEDHYFDGIYCERLFIHLDRPLDALRELIRILKPGEILAISEPDLCSLTFRPDDTEVGKKIVRAICNNINNPAIGSHLLNIMHQAGLKQIGLKAYTVVARQYNYAKQVLLLEETAAHSIASGELGTDEVKNYFEQLQIADGNGTFCFYNQFFTVYGLKEA